MVSETRESMLNKKSGSSTLTTAFNSMECRKGDAVKLKIACMTGTRADYPRVKSVLKEICSRFGLELQLIVTGMHLLDEYGYTVRDIERDGFPIAARVPMFSNDDSPYGMAKAAARCLAGTADALNSIKPDLFLVTVDRVETLAAAQAGALMNLPLAHIQGGEVTGTIDESIRHSVTKLSHIHFPATQEAAERIIRMGEEPENVYAVGCPYLDIVRENLETKSCKTKEELALEYGFDSHRPLMLFTQHAVTTEYGDGRDQIYATLEALKEFPHVEIVAIHSNADAGGREIMEQVKKNIRFHLFPSIESNDYIALMNCADAMLGNSSAGIREAPSFGLPAINIGSRQDGRLRAENIIDAPFDKTAIERAIDKALYNEDFKKSLQQIENPYGDGHSAQRIVDVLIGLGDLSELIQKRIAY